MAGPEWREKPSIAAELFREGHEFSFYQAVRLLELLRPKSFPLGQGTDPAQEAVRLRAACRLAFPASDIAELRDGDPPELVVNFLSLAGAHGPLPHVITEHLLERTHRKDTAFADFLDLFHHRLLSLIYRVHRAHRVGIETGPIESHAFASYLYALLGMGTEGLAGRMKIPDRALLRYTGLLHKSPRDATGLTHLLTDYFAVPVRCEPLIGAFRPLDASQCSSLGDSGQNRQLGIDTKLGSSVWDQQAGIRLVIGPLSAEQYQDFLPGGSRCIALCELSRFYIGPQTDLKVSALLSGADRPPLVLSSLGKKQARLGWTSWLLASLQPPGSVEVDLFELPQFTDQPPTPAPQPSAPLPTEPPKATSADIAAPAPATKAPPTPPPIKATAPPLARKSVMSPPTGKTAAPAPAAKVAAPAPNAKGAPLTAPGTVSANPSPLHKNAPLASPPVSPPQAKKDAASPSSPSDPRKPPPR